MISRKYDGYSNVTGKQIKKYRELNKWSRATLSNRLMMLGIDINYDGIYKIEHGTRIVKDFELAAISQVLNVTEGDLLKDFKDNLN